MSGGQRWQLVKQTPESIRDKTPHKLLIAVVDESMEQEGVALREHRLAELRWSLTRDDQRATELPTFPSDLLERRHTVIVCASRVVAGWVPPRHEGMSLFENQNRRKRLADQPPVTLEPLKKEASHDARY